MQSADKAQSVTYALSASKEQRATYTPCFTAGTLIKTITGEVNVENIVPGDRILTRDNGYQRVVWAAARTLTAQDLAKAPHLTPVKIAQGALGQDLPSADLVISPHHRMLLSNDQIRDWFASDEVLISAEHLMCYPGITRVAAQDVTYVHFMFERHEIVLANGSWSESFQPRDMSSVAMDAGHRREILELFPQLAEDDNAYAAARTTVSFDEMPDLQSMLAPRAQRALS